MAGEAVAETVAVVDEMTLAATVKVLQLSAPELLRAMRAELRADGQVVADAAAVRMASLQKYTRDQPPAADRYKVRFKGPLMQIRQDTRGGSITEFAGKVNPQGKTERGKHLVETLNERYGKPGRVLWHSFDEFAPIMLANLAATVAATEAALDAKLAAV